MVLAKQNGTFKRELASFRKENSTLRKELDKAKGTHWLICVEYIMELEGKAKTLIQEQSQFIANQQNFIQGYTNI